ncbi:hypothetical protein POM88_016437 [Heracleum sosnowskyi]|uniref:Uncharacterized protein n=1 Tax=Heracleum sosnowskyi TaxID=360622 RepID=A0AAD8INK1_9APIA|nr:hypothetical protein POM88_016437 [Heracleum sosnowskyi]
MTEMRRNIEIRRLKFGSFTDLIWHKLKRNYLLQCITLLDTKNHLASSRLSLSNKVEGDEAAQRATSLPILLCHGRELVEPAVKVFHSWPSGKVKDETCWSDKEYCRTTNNWYCFSKTEAELEAWEFAKKNGIN